VSPKLPNLPITEHLERIAAGVRGHTVSILQAPPGSGKTTVLPLYLASQDWLEGRQIVILQPRRLAAKSVAMRMSELLGESVGGTVGYQIRLERKKSANTRVEIITEGLLTRRLLAEPELSDVGLLIFDEFHERSIHADIGLVLAREVATVLRTDLKLLIMSATLDSLASVNQLADAWRYSFEGKPFPVDIHYSPKDPRSPAWVEMARVIQASIQQHPGDVLAFLPGAFEIERCREILERTKGNYTVLPLYGELPYNQQQEALLPRSDGGRKVVLATNIAETSITIEGVRIVVDSGLHKVSRSSETGLTTLKTERISKDSSDQRAGRAGRTAPGVCVRLWSEQEHLALRGSREPEILRTDLTQPVLELAAWGVRHPLDFNWITPPPQKSLLDATRALDQIGAIREDGSITKRGEVLVRLGTHPRIGACCLTACAHDLDSHAAAIIPLLEERAANTKGVRYADFTDMIEALAHGEDDQRIPARIRQLHHLWRVRLGDLPGEKLPRAERVPPLSAPGFLLATAFPERIAKRRPDSRERYLLASGSGATLQPNDPLASREFIVVAELYDRADDAQIIRAVPFDERLIDTHLKHLISQREESYFDSERGVMVTTKDTMLGAIVLRQERATAVSAVHLRAALVTYIQTPEGFAKLPFSTNVLTLQARCTWTRNTHPDASIPDLSSETLRRSEPNWLVNYLPDSGRLEDISSHSIEKALLERLPWPARKKLEELAPQTLSLPSGKTKTIDYSELGEPVVEAIIQEVFGLPETPCIGPHEIPVTLKLLSPARRPMQVTKDLASFWRNGYPAVRKELRGRYPKHKWPEDPRKIDKS